MILVPVSSKFALIDDDMADVVLSKKWYLQTGGYATTFSRRVNGKRGHKLMHRLIVPDVPEGMEIDHINRNKLDNRRSNLRVVTPSENCRNIPARPNKTSRYRGVSWNEKAGKWQVVLRIDGRLKWCGIYESEDEAGAVAAPHFHGIAA